MRRGDRKGVREEGREGWRDEKMEEAGLANVRTV